MRINGSILKISLFAVICAAFGGAFFAAHAETMQVISGASPSCGIPPAASAVPMTQIVLHGVRFKADSAVLEQNSTPVLNYAAAVIRKHPGALIYIAGQPAAPRDAHGADLAQLRAQAVASYLERAGVSKDRLAVLDSGTTPANPGLFAAQSGISSVIELKLTSSANGCNGCS